MLMGSCRERPAFSQCLALRCPLCHRALLAPLTRRGGGAHSGNRTRKSTQGDKGDKWSCGAAKVSFL
jgi:hypothetical protein